VGATAAVDGLDRRYRAVVSDRNHIPEGRSLLGLTGIDDTRDVEGIHRSLGRFDPRVSDRERGGTTPERFDIADPDEPGHDGEQARVSIATLLLRPPPFPRS